MVLLILVLIDRMPYPGQRIAKRVMAADERSKQRDQPCLGRVFGENDAINQKGRQCCSAEASTRLRHLPTRRLLASTCLLSIRYGQRHAVEIEAARKVAQAIGVIRHVEQAIDLRAFGGSALTDQAIDVPRDRPSAAMVEGIPVTYVPARNTVFLSLALAWAETLTAFDIFIGANCVDYSGYPDCRPEYFRAFEALANLATKAGVEGVGRFQIHAPLLTLTKEQIG